MDNKTFQELLDADEIGLILMEGADKLTPEQLQQVKEKSEGLKPSKLKKISKELSKTEGFRDFMLMPIMKSIFSKKNIAPETTVKETKDKNNKKASPFRTHIALGSVPMLKVGDSEADILAKYYNLILYHQKELKKQARIDAVLRGEENKHSRKQYEELFQLITGKKAPTDKKIKKTFQKHQGDISVGSFIKNLFSPAKLITGLGLGSLFLSTPVFAKMQEIILPSSNSSNEYDLPQYKSSSNGKAIDPKKVYDYLTKEKGLDRNSALAIMGNIQRESGFKPGSLGDYKKDRGYTSGGLFQFHNERFQKMVQFAGPDWRKNWKKQIDYALTEPEFKQFEKSGGKSLEEKTGSFVSKFEKPKNLEKEKEIRTRYAEQFAKKIPEKATSVVLNNDYERNIPIKIKKNKQESNPVVVNNVNNLYQGSTTTNMIKPEPEKEASLLQLQYNK